MTYALVAYVFAAVIWVVYLMTLGRRERAVRGYRVVDSE